MRPIPLPAESIPASDKKTVYPPPFAALVEGRTKRKLGEHFGLTNFGVNLTHLSPGSISALFHHHLRQDEFVYILQGAPTLVLGEQEFTLQPGDCIGFKAGTGVAHQLANRSTAPVVYIEVGDKTAGDEVDYPNDDLKATQLPGGAWALTHNDGRPY